MRDDLDEQLLPLFLEEAQELVPSIGSDLRDWKADPANETASLSLRRSLHTLKGSARMAGAIGLGELCHLMETRIKEALDREAFPAGLFDDLQERMDRISLDVERMDAPAEEEASTPRELMRVRAVPFSHLSERLHRTVRQTARDLGKKAQLEIEGASVELDRSVLKRIAAPLEHMLRNALAHGIESPEVRVAAGKPEAGLIAIALRQESDEIALTLSDDGAGLDLARLREQGLERGLLPAGRPPGDAEVAQLIFHPGLSTAEEVSELAGRGVGMDVVKTEIAALGGRVDIVTTQGQGSTFTIYCRSPRLTG